MNALVVIANLSALRGDDAQVRAYLDRLNAETIQWPFLHHHAGSTYEVLGERELALVALERALEGGHHPSAIDDDAFLDDLRSDPRYTALRARYDPPPT